MIYYWDTSALVPCFIEESKTEKCRSWLGSTEEDPKFTSWLTLFEMESAFRRKLNLKQITEEEFSIGQALWNNTQSGFNFIPLDVRIARTGSRLQKLYQLKSGDGVQLGSAAILQLEDPEVQFISLDQALVQYAKQEGFLLPDH